MRFLANENFPGDAIAALASAGHDIVWIRTAAPGSKDEDILAWAVREQRVLLTFDQDFGELAWRVGLPASCGIMLFRLPMPAVAGVGAALAARIGERSDWAGHFTVIEPGRVRMRPLAAQQSKIGVYQSARAVAFSADRVVRSCLKRGHEAAVAAGFRSAKERPFSGRRAARKSLSENKATSHHALAVLKQQGLSLA